MVKLVVPDAFGRRDESNGLDAEGERRVDACTIIQLIGGISRAIAGASPALIAARLYTTQRRRHVAGWTTHRKGWDALMVSGAHFGAQFLARKERVKERLESSVSHGVKRCMKGCSYVCVL